MTAENLPMTLWEGGTPPYVPGMEFTVGASFTIASAVETGDSWTATNILPVQKVVVVRGRSYGADYDTHATPTATVVVGDGTDTDGYLESKVAGSGSGAGEANQELRFGGVLISGPTIPAGRSITETLGGTVATAASTGTRHIEVTYRCVDGDRVV